MELGWIDCFIYGFAKILFSPILAENNTLQEIAISSEEWKKIFRELFPSHATEVNRMQYARKLGKWWRAISAKIAWKHNNLA